MDFKVFRGLLPYISVYLIAVGILRIILFYKYFDIPILDYIGIEEIIILFADDILFALGAYVLPLALFTLYDDRKSIIKSTIKDNPTIITPQTLKTNTPKQNNPFIKVYIILFFLLIVGMAINYYTKNEFFHLVVTICFIVIGLLSWVFNMLKNSYFEIKGEPIDLSYILIFICSVTFAFFTIVYSQYTARHIKMGLYQGTSIVTKDTTYSTDLYKVYIGKTKDYAYMYDLKKEKAVIIPASEIKEISIKKNSMYELFDIKEARKKNERQAKQKKSLPKPIVTQKLDSTKTASNQPINI